MPEVKPIPDNYPPVSAHLSIAGAAAAIEFYASVFGATERMRMGMPDGMVAHAELELGGSVIMIGEEMPGGVDPSPKTLGGSPVALFVYVEDVDDIFSRRPSPQARKLSRNRKTTSTATASRCLTTPSGTAGTSPPTSRTSHPTRWSGA